MVVRAQALVCALVAGALLAPPASGHGIGAIERGYVSNVSHIRPAVLGLEARVLGGQDRLSVRNWSRKRVVIVSSLGQADVIAPGATRALHDHRIGWYSDEAPAVLRRDPDEPHYVRAWRVPGTQTGDRSSSTATSVMRRRHRKPETIVAGSSLRRSAAGVALLAGVAGARRMRRAP